MPCAATSMWPKGTEECTVSTIEWFDVRPWNRVATSWWVFYAVVSTAYVFALRSRSATRPRIGSRVVVAWNAALSVFSIWGALTSGRHYARRIATAGVAASLCGDGEWFCVDEMGLAMLLFVASKPVELVDTLILRLRGKQIGFLHWFHHLSVMWYTWHAFVVRTSIGIAFATINYHVHALMYTYYALTQSSTLRPLLERASRVITVIQIAQMCVGLSVCVYALTTEGCNHDPVNTLAATAMYGAYLLLFVHFYYRRNVIAQRKTKVG